MLNCIYRKTRLFLFILVNYSKIYFISILGIQGQPIRPEVTNLWHIGGLKVVHCIVVILIKCKFTNTLVLSKNLLVERNLCQKFKLLIDRKGMAYMLNIFLLEFNGRAKDKGT